MPSAHPADDAPDAVAAYDDEPAPEPAAYVAPALPADDAGASALVTLADIAGRYCGADGSEWLVPELAPVVVAREGVTRMGTPTVVPGRLEIAWSQVRSLSGEWSPMRGTSFYRLTVGDGWIGVDGVRLTLVVEPVECPRGQEAAP